MADVLFSQDFLSDHEFPSLDDRVLNDFQQDPWSPRTNLDDGHDVAHDSFLEVSEPSFAPLSTLPPSPRLESQRFEHFFVNNPEHPSVVCSRQGSKRPASDESVCPRLPICPRPTKYAAKKPRVEKEDLSMQAIVLKFATLNKGKKLCIEHIQAMRFILDVDFTDVNLQILQTQCPKFWAWLMTLNKPLLDQSVSQSDAISQYYEAQIQKTTAMVAPKLAELENIIFELKKKNQNACSTIQTLQTEVMVGQNRTQEWERQMSQDRQRQLALYHADLESKLAQQREDYERQLTKQREDYERQLTKQREDYDRQLTKQREDNDSQLIAQRTDFDSQLTAQRAALEVQRQDYDSQLSAQCTTLEQQRKDFESQLAEQRATFAKQACDIDFNCTQPDICVMPMRTCDEQLLLPIADISAMGFLPHHDPNDVLVSALIADVGEENFGPTFAQCATVLHEKLKHVYCCVVPHTSDIDLANSANFLYVLPFLILLKSNRELALQQMLVNLTTTGLGDDAARTIVEDITKHIQV